MEALRHQNIAQCMADAALRFSGRTALRHQKDAWSYQNMEKTTNQLATGLLALGLGPGRHVAFWADATPNAVFTFFALQKIGAVVVMLNTCLEERELQKQLAVADADFLVVGDSWKEKHFVQDYPNITAQFSTKQGLYIGTEEQGHWPSYVQALAAGGSEERERLSKLFHTVQPEDLALMLFTSGTTGEYKAVCSSGFHLVNGGLLKANSMEMTSDDVVCCAIPLFHIFCIDVNLMAALLAGACLALPDDRHTKTVLRCIQEMGCTVLSSVPSTFLALIGRRDFSSFDVSTLRTGIIGGAGCTPQQFCEIDRALDFTLLPGLGQSEVAAGVSVGRRTDSLEVRSTTVGHFVPFIEGKIVPVNPEANHGGAPIGEVCVRGPMLMKGYYKRPELTAQAIDGEGWLHTGDLGWLDTEENLHLAGRIKDVIIRGGENIMPSELEQLLDEDPCVANCKAIGVPDDHYGEEVCLCVVPAEGASLGREQILERLSGKLAAFKLPKYILFLDALPYTDTGKVDRKRLSCIAREGLLKL